MAVTISIKGDPEADRICFSDDDPLYWFLFPYFQEIDREVGQMIDLDTSVEFFAEELLGIFLVLENAMSDAMSRDHHWDETIFDSSKDVAPSVKSLSKKDAVARVDGLMQMVNRAYNDGRSLICVAG